MRQLHLSCAVALLAAALLAAPPALAQDYTADSFIGDWEGSCMLPHDSEYKCLKKPVAQTSYLTVSKYDEQFKAEWTDLKSLTTLEDTKTTVSHAPFSHTAELDLVKALEDSDIGLCLASESFGSFTWILGEQEVYEGKTVEVLYQAGTIKSDGKSKCVDDGFKTTLTCDPDTYESTYYCVYFKREKSTPGPTPYYPKPSSPEYPAPSPAYRRLMAAAPRPYQKLKV